jgi:hypothetical protein
MIVPAAENSSVSTRRLSKSRTGSMTATLKAGILPVRFESPVHIIGNNSGLDEVNYPVARLTREPPT